MRSEEIVLLLLNNIRSPQYAIIAEGKNRGGTYTHGGNQPPRY